MTDEIITIKNLCVNFKLRGKTLSAIRDLSLSVLRGESLAIVGESGCGKSVLVKTITGLLDRNGYVKSGSIVYNGRELTELKRDSDWLWLRGGEIAMIMQDPLTSLNPLKTVGDQILEAIELHRDLSKDEANELVVRLLEDVGIEDAKHRRAQYPHEFSGGMRQRVVIAIAVACNPSVLVCDEPTTALDVTIQAQILDLLKELKKKYNLTIIFITHDLGVVANIADRVAVMYAGDIVEYGLCDEIFYDAKHPYTWALLSSLPQLGLGGDELFTIKGSPPNLFADIRGDAFAPRNPFALNIDFIERPPLFKVSPTHYARTWLLDPRAPSIKPPEALTILSKGGARFVR